MPAAVLLTHWLNLIQDYHLVGLKTPAMDENSAFLESVSL